jgi:predicted nucleic acid-binding protein
MIVLDASAVIELLLNSRAGERVSARIYEDRALHAPHFIDVEVMHVLRRQCALGRLDPIRALAGLDLFQNLPMRRHAHQPFLRRIWELRHNLTAYDACYIALAESLGAVLLTMDSALASASHRASVEIA